jgi:hypothetical protein
MEHRDFFILCAAVGTLTGLVIRFSPDVLTGLLGFSGSLTVFGIVTWYHGRPGKPDWEY